MRTGFKGWYVVLEDMHYWKTCGSGDHDFHGNICWGRTCLIDGYVLNVCEEATTI